MTNFPLLQNANIEDFKKLGFIEEPDGSGDPRGTDWNYRNDKFHIVIDCGFEVRIAHRFPDTDYITVVVDDLHDLQNVIDFANF